MKYLYYFLGIVSLSLSCTSCDPLDTNVCQREYVFSVPVSLTPVTDTFQLGSTIQVDIKFSPNILDDNSGENFDLSSFPFNTEIVVIKIDQTPFSDSSGYVSYAPLVGDLNIIPLPIGGTEAVQVHYAKNDSTLQFKCLITLNKKGTFELYYHSFFLDEFKEEIKEGCKTKSIEISYGLETDDTNFEFHQLSPDPKVSNVSKEIFDKNGAFSFVVTD